MRVIKRMELLTIAIQAFEGNFNLFGKRDTVSIVVCFENHCKQELFLHGTRGLFQKLLEACLYAAEMVPHFSLLEWCLHHWDCNSAAFRSIRDVLSGLSNTRLLLPLCCSLSKHYNAHYTCTPMDVALPVIIKPARCSQDCSVVRHETHNLCGFSLASKSTPDVVKFLSCHSYILWNVQSCSGIARIYFLCLLHHAYTKCTFAAIITIALIFVYSS